MKMETTSNVQNVNKALAFLNSKRERLNAQDVIMKNNYSKIEHQDELIKALRHAFKIKEIKESVLDKEWLAKNYESNIDSTGFCRIACEIIYKLNGGKERWMVKVISKKKWEHGSHYYLEEKSTKAILDITSDQYRSKNICIPYGLGRGTGLRTNPEELSKKAQILAKYAGINF
jgi:hypothetical protein